MTKREQVFSALTLAFALIACGDDDAASDAGMDATTGDAGATEDADPPVDASPSDGSADAGPPEDAGPGQDLLSGIYNVETVTCGGEVVPIRVTATVTFDDTSYLEEWVLAESDCEVTFAGTLESTETEVTLRDVEVSCAEACDAIGFCDATHCSADQVYQYTRTGDELLLSFTQQGDEFSCGPCGDGIASTYLLAELP